MQDEDEEQANDDDNDDSEKTKSKKGYNEIKNEEYHHFDRLDNDFNQNKKIIKIQKQFFLTLYFFNFLF